MLEELLNILINHFQEKGKKLETNFIKYKKDDNIVFQFTLWLDNKKITLARYAIREEDYQKEMEISVKTRLILTTIINLNIMAINKLSNK